MEKILIIDAGESTGFRFIKEFSGKYDLTWLDPRSNFYEFIDKINTMPDVYDYVINNFDIYFFSKNQNLIDLNYKVQILIDNIFRRARKILISSQFVYSSSEKMKDEASDTDPDTYYGKTKLNAENEVKKTGNYIIFRSGMAYGKCMHNIYTDILAAIRSGIPMKLNANVYINPTLNQDESTAIEKAIHDTDNEIYNTGSGDGITMYDFGNLIYRSIKSKNSNFIKIYNDVPLNYRINSGKICNRYNFKFSSIG